MIDRLADRWAPFIIISGLILGAGWLGYAAATAYSDSATHSARSNNR